MYKLRFKRRDYWLTDEEYDNMLARMNIENFSLDEYGYYNNPIKCLPCSIAKGNCDNCSLAIPGADKNNCMNMMSSCGLSRMKYTVSFCGDIVYFYEKNRRKATLYLKWMTFLFKLHTKKVS